MEEVEAVERVSRVTDHADEVAVLVGTGMRSAMEIASHAAPARSSTSMARRSAAARRRRAFTRRRSRPPPAPSWPRCGCCRSVQHVPFGARRAAARDQGRARRAHAVSGRRWLLRLRALRFGLQSRRLLRRSAALPERRYARSARAAAREAPTDAAGRRSGDRKAAAATSRSTCCSAAGPTSRICR